MKMSFIKNATGGLDPIGEPVPAYKKWLVGEERVFDVKKQRNPKYHRLAFSWMQSVFANQDRYETFPQFRAALTIAAGYVKCTITRMRKGRVTCPHCSNQIPIDIEQTTVVPESISFESMDENQFQEWQKNCDQVLLQSGINTEIGFH